MLPAMPDQPSPRLRRGPRPVVTVVVLALLVSCAAPGGGQPSDGGDEATIRFFPIAISDPFAGNLDAFVFLVPDAWQYEGSVQWLPEWVRAAFLQTRISDPVTGTVIEWLPIQDFIYFQAPAGAEAPLGGNYQGKVYLPPITDPAEFVAQFWVPGALAHLQGAQLVNVEQVPAIAEEFVRQFGGPADAFAYRMRYAYQQDGQAWEEDVSFALLFSGTPELTSWYVQFAYTVRAPQGELDRNAGVISTIVASRNDAGCEATYRPSQRSSHRHPTADGRHGGLSDAGRYRAEIAALQQQVTKERQASQDRIAELRRETLGGVETYSDPFTGAPVQLPVGWNEYWVNDRGEYLTSDQAGFDPNTLNQGNWQRLERRNP
jgi:hypothetical protein